MTTKSEKTASAVRYDEIEGKTVSGAGYGFDCMLIAFTDGTVLALRAESTYDGAELDFEQDCDIDLLGKRWSSEANEAGLITRDEWLKAEESRKAQQITRLERELNELKQGR